jgi:Aspartyl/Asparaginyl beta-hydroxylase
MNEPICIFGSGGKIGSMFHKLFPGASCPRYNIDYDDHRVFDPLKLTLEKSNTIILCHHNIKNPWQIYILTRQIVNYVRNDPAICIINIASDAEIIPIPLRLQYGQMKKRLRKDLNKRMNRVIHIFFPHVNKRNISTLYSRLQSLNWKYDYYYFSDISAIVKPLDIQHILWNEKIEGLEFKNNGRLSQLIDDRTIYEKVRMVVEQKIRIQLVPFDSIPFNFIMWKLQFEHQVKPGHWHRDMKRCVFGKSLRTIICIENTSDYRIAVEDEVFTMQENDILILPNTCLHKPLDMNHGKRVILIFDFFTNNFPHLLYIIIFFMFNYTKLLGKNA